MPDLSESESVGERRSTNVPGQYLGYSIQASRLLDHLLVGKRGESVSLEVFADTGVLLADGSVVAEESKNRITRANPIADRSVDFWKTFRNWIGAVKDGRLQPSRTIFRLYVSQSFRGAIAESFDTARDTASARAAFTAAKALLWDDPATRTTNAALLSELEVVFTTEAEVVSEIITSFELKFGSGSTFEDLKVRIAEKFVEDGLIEVVMDTMLGWIKRKTDEAIAREEPAIVHYNEFHRMATDLIQRLNQRGILQTLASDPTRNRVEEELRLRTYVRQLELIELDEQDKLEAVIEFCKAEADCAKWAEMGRVHKSDVEQFEEELMTIWRHKKRKCDIDHSSRSEVEQGAYLYSDCCLHEGTLRGERVPLHFCRGSLHALADRPAIGWHPKYPDLLTREPNADEPR